MTMTIGVLEKFFVWMTVINFGILLFCPLLLPLCRGSIYKLHGAWFKIPEEKIDIALYKMLGTYKIIVIVFNLVPYIALKIIC